jgi:hypothetical protein
MAELKAALGREGVAPASLAEKAPKAVQSCAAAHLGVSQ